MGAKAGAEQSWEGTPSRTRTVEYTAAIVVSTSNSPEGTLFLHVVVVLIVVKSLLSTECYLCECYLCAEWVSSSQASSMHQCQSSSESSSSRFFCRPAFRNDNQRSEAHISPYALEISMLCLPNVCVNSVKALMPFE